MYLQRLEFKQLVNQPSQWTAGPMELNAAMLVVGKNAAGKSRLMAVLWNLASIIRGTQKPLSGTWSVCFQNGTDTIEYELSCEQYAVNAERLRINGTVKLEREADGTGALDATGTGQTTQLRFQLPTTALAVVAKRDFYQHKYLEPLHEWAASVRYYPFGSGMGREQFAILLKDAPPADPSDWRRTLGLFTRATKEFPDIFKSSVCLYMAKLGYALTDIDIKPAPVEIVDSDKPLPGPLVCLAVQEQDLSCWTNQIEMSQGMFRALALMIHLAYAELSGQPGCILLDDVGEGLDYERSTEMIRLLLEIASKNKVQVLMSTNDRFVMNAVPLEQWAIIRRKRSHCEILTYKNSMEMFEEFKLTGLSNFDLLSSGFFDQAPPVS